MLLKALLRLIGRTESAFAQKRSGTRAGRLMLCGLLTLGHRWITRMMASVGRTTHKPYAEYKLFSRSPWDTATLFAPLRAESATYMDDELLPIALDETKIPRSGKKIKDARWMRDPMSPPFHVNFVWGLRFLQFSALLPLHKRYGEVGARGIPVAFESVPSAKKPPKKASDEQKKAFKNEQREHTLSKYAVRGIQGLRKEYDQDGLAHKTVLVVGDGAFSNRTVFRADYERTILLARTRKDAALCFPAPKGDRRTYGKTVFRPEEVAKDERIPWQQTSVFHGGTWRTVRYKEGSPVLWRRGAGRKRLRLIVVAPTPYRNTKKGRLYYRERAYLLCTDLKVPAQPLLQAYFDRWQIEVNHRDEKAILGVGEAQVRADRSVPRQPAFTVAAYGLLLLAGLKAYGPLRTADYLPLPAWRKPASRPSCLDLIALLRDQAEEHPELLEPYEIEFTARQAMRAASA